MKNPQQSYAISDSAWLKIAYLLSGRAGQWGGVAADNRLFINAVFWVLRTGLPWRDLPPEYGKWGTVHQRFNRWRKEGKWESIIEILIWSPEFDWLVRRDESSKYAWPWMRMICRSEDLLYRIPQKYS